MPMTGKRYSQLFTVRVWLRSGEPSATALRIKVHHLLSGEVRYFLEWSALVAYLDAMFDDGEEAALNAHCPNDPT